jgi:hypothetical protein
MADELTFDHWMSFPIWLWRQHKRMKKIMKRSRDEIDDLILYDSPAIMQVIEVVIQGFQIHYQNR